MVRLYGLVVRHFYKRMKWLLCALSYFSHMMFWVRLISLDHLIILILLTGHTMPKVISYSQQSCTGRMPTALNTALVLRKNKAARKILRLAETYKETVHGQLETLPASQSSMHLWRGRRSIVFLQMFMMSDARPINTLSNNVDILNLVSR